MQNTAYEMRISDWSSDVCSSDLVNNASVLISAHRASLKTPPRGVLPSRRSGRIRSNTPTAATSLLGPRVVTLLTEALDFHKVANESGPVLHIFRKVVEVEDCFQRELDTFVENHAATIERIQDTGGDRKSTRLNSSH